MIVLSIAFATSQLDEAAYMFTTSDNRARTEMSKRFLLLTAIAAVSSLTLLGFAGTAWWILKHAVRPSPDELEARTISRNIEAWKKDAFASLTIAEPASGVYEVGFEFPGEKPKQDAYHGVVRIEVFAGEKSVITKEASGMKRAYYADATTYRIIALSDIDLEWHNQTTKVLVTVIKADASFRKYDDMKVFVRPLPVK